jgi:hypothetical protein
VSGVDRFSAAQVAMLLNLQEPRGPRFIASAFKGTRRISRRVEGHPMQLSIYGNARSWSEAIRQAHERIAREAAEALAAAGASK